jgi:hypothetical protein
MMNVTGQADKKREQALACRSLLNDYTLGSKVLQSVSPELDA